MNDSHLRAKALLNSTINSLENDLKKYQESKHAKKYFVEIKAKTINDLKEVEDILEGFKMLQFLLSIEAEINSLLAKDESISRFIILLNTKEEENHIGFIQINQFFYE